MSHQRGNILFYVLIGIVLVGLLTVALRNTGNMKDNIDSENLVIRAGEVQRHAGEVEKAVGILIGNRVSESDIRFAHPDAPAEYGTITTNPTFQIFSETGGMATYRLPPSGVNDGSKWEFYGTSDIPEVGSDQSELIAVLPNVTQEFCKVINAQLGFTAGTQPLDDLSGASPDCVQGAAVNRFTGTFDTTPNMLDKTTFSVLPSYQGCVTCASDNSYHYFHVLLSR